MSAEDLIPTPFTIHSPRLVFIGNILPRYNTSSLEITPTIRWNSPDLDLECIHVLSIKEGVIRNECTLNKFNEEIAGRLLMQTLDLAQGVLDVLVFSIAHVMTAEIHTRIAPDGQVSHLLLQAPHLADLSTAFRLSKGEMLEILPMVLTSPPLYRALNDLVSAISRPYQAPLECARAVEGLRNMMAPDLPRKQQWAVMRENLRLETSYVEFITGLSQAPRHGDRTFIPMPQSRECLDRAWTIMNRYFAFRRGGSTPLSASDFPVLS